MDRFIEQSLSAPKLKRLNLCLLWLRVTLLSDILCTLQGSQVERNAWLGSSPMPSSDANWPVQPRTQEKIWTLWCKAISNSYPGELTTKLGAWLPSAQTQKSPQWKAFFEHSTQCFFLPADQPSTYYKVSTDTHLDFSLTRYDFSGPKHIIPAAELPNKAAPVQPTTDGGSSCANQLNAPAIR
jgi:hypothetical protein